MECEFKCKSETLKFQRYVENLQNLSKEFIDLTQRYIVHAKTNINWTSSKVKNFALQKTL